MQEAEVGEIDVRLPPVRPVYVWCRVRVTRARARRAPSELRSALRAYADKLNERIPRSKGSDSLPGALVSCARGVRVWLQCRARAVCVGVCNVLRAQATYTRLGPHLTLSSVMSSIRPYSVQM